MPWAGCARNEAPNYGGGWVGAQHERGHRLRELKSGSPPEPAVQRRAGVIKALIQGGQHDRTLRQTQHCPHQADGRRNAAGDTSNDHWPSRRMRGKPLRFRCNHLIAPQRWR